MRKISILFLIIGLTIFSCDDDDEKEISLNKLPVNSQEFIKTHFPEAGIRFIEQDKDGYEVYFTNGFQADFYLNGDWENVNAKAGALSIPESILKLEPINIIQAYISEKYPNNVIVEIDKEFILAHKTNGYEITLNNRVELLFDNLGKYLGIDY